MSKKVKLKNVNEVFSKYLSKEEMADADNQAEIELLALKILQEDVSKFVTQVMAHQNLGFRAFARENNLSLSMASKIIKGAGNLTLETVAQIAAHYGKKAHITFSD